MSSTATVDALPDSPEEQETSLGKRVMILVMVVLGFCLITGVFYSWARGSVSYAHDSPATNEASGLLD